MFFLVDGTEDGDDVVFTDEGGAPEEMICGGVEIFVVERFDGILEVMEVAGAIFEGEGTVTDEEVGVFEFGIADAHYVFFEQTRLDRVAGFV